MFFENPGDVIIKAFEDAENFRKNYPFPKRPIFRFNNQQVNDEAEWIKQIRDYCKGTGTLPTHLIEAHRELKRREATE